jgi:hypothetical protein
MNYFDKFVPFCTIMQKNQFRFFLMSPMARKKRNITGLRGQPKLAISSRVKNTDSDVPLISNSDLPQSSSSASDPDPDSDEEEWCPNLQFDSSKPEWDTLLDTDLEDDIDSLSKILSLYPAPQIPAGIRSFQRIPVDSGGIKFGRRPCQIAIPGTNYSGGIKPFRN